MQWLKTAANDTAVTEETHRNRRKGSAFLTMDSKESIASGILDLLTLTQEYQESLQLIQEKKTDKVVLLAQSCLLELIEQYHIFIAQESQMEIGSWIIAQTYWLSTKI